MHAYCNEIFLIIVGTCGFRKYGLSQKIDKVELLNIQQNIEWRPLLSRPKGTTQILCFSIDARISENRFFAMSPTYNSKIMNYYFTFYTWSLLLFGLGSTFLVLFLRNSIPTRGHMRIFSCASMHSLFFVWRPIDP